MPGWYRVSGESMLPTLPAGTLLLTLKRTPKVGHIVVAEATDGTVVVKRIGALESDGSLHLASDNPTTASVYTERPFTRHQLLGEVIATWPPRRLRAID